MGLLENLDDVMELVEGLHFKEKIERSLVLIKEAYEKYGDSLVVANSLGKDSVCVWHLAKRVSPKIRGFIVTTRFKPEETVQFMHETVAQYPELKVY
jgi:3'-phosphoadenosine 5'-phosphosulfate sulfotransferase (PAPS reductase)/FAD synthetase